MRKTCYCDRICYVLRDFVPFVQFKKREKHLWMSVNFTKINTPPWVFFTFFKLCKWYEIAQRTTYTQFYSNETVATVRL